MYRQLKQHYRTTESAIARLETEANDSSKDFSKQVESLYSYHLERVHDFQHERLIHLLVTLFFGFLVIVALLGVFFSQVPPIVGTPNLDSLIVLLAAILLITELFYIRHYFQLENGVQRLYTLTERIQALR